MKGSCMTEIAEKGNRIQEFLGRARRLQPVMEQILFPVVLALWPLWGTWSGVDVMDSGFSLGNYEMLGEGMWFYATFLANQVGKLLMVLPGGSGLLAMNVKTAMLVSLAAVCAYYTMKRLMPGWMVFLGEMIAVSVFWCPTVILYNSLSYVLLAFACLCLFRAVNSVPHSRRWYVLAGVCLGLNLFVRFSNALQVVLILAVWLEEFWSKRSLQQAIKDTVLCLAGYLAAVCAVFVWIAAGYGIPDYISGIMDLFSMGGDYTFAEMLRLTVDAYATALMWMMFMIACVAGGMILMVLPVLKDHRKLARLIYLVGICALIRFYWGRGMFTTNYQDYWCMFNWVMLFLLLTIGLNVICLLGGYGANTDERFLSALSLLLILLLPFGSNNYTFPILLELFIIAPFSLWMFRRIWQEHRRERMHFPWYSMGIVLMLAVLVQGTLFHLEYSFRDGTDGTARDTRISALPAAEGTYTTKENAKELEGIYTYLESEQLTDRTLLAFGDAPGLNYLLGMEPALSTTWPDLASFLPEERFEKELRELSGVSLTGHTETMPVVILHRQNAEDPELTENLTTQEGRKAGALSDFLAETGYETVYESDHYVVKVMKGISAQAETDIIQE